MDDELYDAFITESEESITQLNNSLLTLESNPDDHEAIDDIFRRAHTLKGNFAAMGFDDASTVAHAIEDLLDEVRHDRLDVTPERMDLVFDGIDLIVDILHDIQSNGESTIDPTETVDAIRAAAEGDGPADAGDGTAATDEDADAAPDDGDETTEHADALDADAAAALDVLDEAAVADIDELCRVEITLDGGGMKGVDAGLFLGGIPDSVEIAGARPSLDDIEAGEFDDGFDLFVAGLGAAETADTFGDLWSVEDATVTDVSAALAAASGEATTPAAEPTATANGEASNGEASNGVESNSAGSATTTDSNADSASDADDGHRSISAVKSVRVDVDQLDELHELVEQLVTSRIKLRQAIDGGDATGLDTLDELDKISSNLQNTVMDMRLIPLKKVFDKFPRLVRDLAREQDKRVDFRVEGQDIELDRTILDEISDPLMHVLRNSVDHGIEPPEERAAAGKDETGVVELSAEREHDTVVITIEDDGRGLDVEKIRQKAVTEDVATERELDAMLDTEIYELIFHPGFSTNEEITDVSGRGVGMDVVKTTVEALDGSVAVDSTVGEGTTIRIRLPVSVAIIKVLFVQVDDREFGVPIKYIDEISRLNRVETINGAEVVVHEDRIFPLIRLRDALEVDAPTTDEGMVVRIRPADRQVALRCDGVSRQEEVVVTPLQGPLGGTDGLSGTSVIGDGNVIPILDVGTLQIPEAGKQAVRDHRTDDRSTGEAAD